MMTQVAQRGSVAARKEGWSLPRITHNPSRRRVQSKGGVGAAGSGLLRETQGMTTRARLVLQAAAPASEVPLLSGAAASWLCPSPSLSPDSRDQLISGAGKTQRTLPDEREPFRPFTPPHPAADRTQACPCDAPALRPCLWTSPRMPLDVTPDTPGRHPGRLWLSPQTPPPISPSPWDRFARWAVGLQAARCPQTTQDVSAAANHLLLKMLSKSKFYGTCSPG